ncbi:hypothetical protein FNV43_RR11069 [Rhamnella rubrinervis]|uniref:Uncharacterized protein n=1 Tax=Rhamnella rubrinervis TaxID=2594499 RepID=A0A8K0H4W9_9ROSA|nr:hypothetical protein FNV43_RR11069 [Rhamnella rubrinervis]
MWRAHCDCLVVSITLAVKFWGISILPFEGGNLDHRGSTPRVSRDLGGIIYGGVDSTYVVNLLRVEEVVR